MKHGYYDIAHGATVDLIRYKGEAKFAIVSRIEVRSEHRGNGYASQLMEQMLQDADEEGVMLALSIEPDGTGLNETQLREWYTRLGFVFRPEAPDDSTTMVRMPTGYEGDPLNLETFGQPRMDDA